MPSSTRTVLRPFLALAVTLAMISPDQGLQAAEPDDVMALTAENMLERCKDMQTHKQQMMADMKAQDAALAEQVVQMNSAADDKKLGLLTALVTRMAEQRVANNARMAKMGDSMMQHMMHHMQMGKGKDSTPGCPMMQADDKTRKPGKPLM